MAIAEVDSRSTALLFDRVSAPVAARAIVDATGAAEADESGELPGAVEPLAACLALL